VISDTAWVPILMSLWIANRKVYGADKPWKVVRRAGRDQVARLMREMGIWGGTRRRKVFTAERPDVLWVTGLT
jgi:putative transposase